MIDTLLAVFLGVAVVALVFGDARGAIREHRRMDDFEPATSEDPRCIYTRARQLRVAARMHREGKSLLTDCAYKPTLTRAQAAPPKAHKVIVPFRRP